MSAGRPVDPYEFASDTNYPAGAEDWSAQPCKLSPLDSKWTPGVPPAAEEHNYVLNRIGADARALNNTYGDIPALNWSPVPNYNTSMGVGSFESFEFVFWSNILRRWVIPFYHDTGTHAVAISKDGMFYFPTLSTGTPPAIVSAACDFTPQGRVYFNNVGATTLSYIDSVAGTWGTVAASLVITDKPQLFQFANKLVHTGRDASAYNEYLINASPGISAWTARAPLANTYLISANSADRLMTINYDYANAANVNYETTDDLTTFTARSLSTSILAATEKVRAVHYCAADSLWYLFIETVGGGFKVASSPDAIAWTARGSLGATYGSVWDVASLGTSLLVCLEDADQVATLLVSTDQGDTWRFTDADLYPSTGTGGTARVVAGEGHFAWKNFYTLRMSAAVGQTSAAT